MSAQVISGVSCPSVSLCVAVDEGGHVLTSGAPAAGAAAWSVGTIERHGDFAGVSCPSVHLCIAAASGMAISTHPARAGSCRWIPEPPNRDHIKGITGISCAGPRLCVGADIMGLVFVSTHPSGGVRSWRVA